MAESKSKQNETAFEMAKIMDKQAEMTSEYRRLREMERKSDSTKAEMFRLYTNPTFGKLLLNCMGLWTGLGEEEATQAQAYYDRAVFRTHEGNYPWTDISVHVQSFCYYLKHVHPLAHILLISKSLEQVKPTGNVSWRNTI